jgi:hypothetical protein
MSKIDFKNVKLPAIKINAVIASKHIPPMSASEVREKMTSLEISIIEKLNQNLNQNKYG